MVDKHIATWWRKNKARSGLAGTPDFAQRSDGWIEATTAPKTKRSWQAYLAWARFCHDGTQHFPG